MLKDAKGIMKGISLTVLGWKAAVARQHIARYVVPFGPEVALASSRNSPQGIFWLLGREQLKGATLSLNASCFQSRVRLSLLLFGVDLVGSFGSGDWYYLIAPAQVTGEIGRMD